MKHTNTSKGSKGLFLALLVIAGLLVLAMTLLGIKSHYISPQQPENKEENKEVGGKTFDTNVPAAKFK
jgi:chromatin segregation and condensation protein Rec8/ScpA/Scc1 (kleisin family)|tara:strand:+ start:268 stop:471 length:204 start_codon:yes stop_codon:yes gene_type:complete